MRQRTGSDQIAKILRQFQADLRLWKEEYNTERPDRSLSGKTPAECAAHCERYSPIDETPAEQPRDEQPYP